MLYIDAQEVEQYQREISNLRNRVEKLQSEKHKINQELKFLKDSGDEILVIEKSENDIIEYKSTEKELLSKIVSENQTVREKYDMILREKDNIDNQKQIVLLKYKELEHKHETDVNKLKTYITYLENRTLKDRIFNTIKQVETNNIQPRNILLDEVITPIEIIYTEDELLKLEADAKSIKKPRGWHFKEKFIDSEGNIYHKGKLQPYLKK